MLPSHLTPRKKGFIRLTLFVTMACLMIAAISSFNASAQGAESGLWRRFFNAPITTVQQVFGLAKSPTAAAPAPMFATITVNSTVDGPMATLNANTTCDLREAIVAANNNVIVGQCAAGAPGLDTIDFSIGTGTPTIAIALDGAMMPQSLPNIIEPIIINGATGGATRVEINGMNSEAGLAGLFLNGAASGGSTIQSLVLNRFQGNGIQISNSSNNTIKNCYIGTNAAGTAASANRDNGIAITNGGTNNTIGGSAATDRNILSGNGSSGVFIVDPTTTNNKLMGNYLGLNAAGTAAVPNAGNGVFIRNSGNNTIGGLVAGERNVISGNGFDGVFIGESLDMNGMVINPASGGNKVIGNYIGTNAAGTAAIGNLNDGLLLSHAYSSLVQGNVISGNGVRGIWIFEFEAVNNIIIGNKVGTDAAGTADIGNVSHGIFMQDSMNNTIGGTALGEGNIIAFNSNHGTQFSGSVGIRVTDTHLTKMPPLALTAVGNKFLGNSVFSNELRGIELGVNLFPNVNDLGDPDVGPNNFQNYPVLTCAVSGSGTTTVKGTLNSLASTKFRIEFFSNDACHPVGNGEGKVYLGFQNVTTDASGNATINAPLAATVAPGKFITSTATKLGAADAPVETSEFSACQAVTAAPTLAINNVTANEGNAGTTNFVFTVTLSAVSTCGDVTVNYATADGTATTANADYVATNGTLTFTGSNLTQTITVQVNGDLTPEATETFFVNLTNASGAGITTAQGTGTITNDDTAKTLAINDVTVTEGDSGTVNANFTVSLNVPATQTLTVQYATADSTATAPSDYTAVALTTLTFNPGDQTKQVTVVVNGDTTTEPNETFFVNLSNSSGATFTKSQGVGTITDDDVAKTLSINNVTVTEADSGTVNANFTVSLNVPATGTITVQYATANDTATAPSDYTALTLTTLTFNPGDQTKQITVMVNGDTLVEPTEQFFVNLSNPSGATFTKSQGIGTITNDDAATVAINDVAVTEGDSGTVNATFTVTLSKPSASAVTVQYATADGTAATPSDYTALALTTLTFNANETTKQITVVVNGDTTVEANETFFVNLSNASGATISDNQGIGTITNDDFATIAINDAPAVNEGNSGTVNATFTVTLSKPSSEQVTVTYATANGTATTADNDYVAVAGGTVIFAAGETSKTVAVTVNGDTKVEANETFVVNLSSIVGNNANVTDPTLGKSQGTGTINNDDAATVAINDVMVTEGNSGTVNATFSVSLSAPADQPVVINFATAAGSASAPADYVATNGSVTFPANSNAAQTITVQVIGETLAEADETFVVNLTPNSLPAGVTIADNAGLGTIKDDDSTQAPALTASMSDPFACNGVGGPVQVTAELTNPNPNSQIATFAVTLPSMLTAVANSCTATTGTCTVTLPNQINWMGTLAAGQKVTISYRATVANGTPNGQMIVINSTGTIAGKNTSASASGTVSCPPNTAPTTISASGQKVGSILVFPYYTSKASTRADTRLTLSNVGAAQTIVHLFLIAGSNCQQADLYVCLTPYASISIKASDYDPETTGWMMAVAVDKDGFPVQNNALIGNAFLQEDNYIDNYSAVSFAARSAEVATRGSNNTAVLQFNNSGYDAVPDQFAVELQSPLDAVGQKVVTVGLSGNLNNSALSGASQIGTGLVINGNEKPSGSFVAWLSGGCQATALINASAPRVPGGMSTMIPKGQVGTMFFRIGSGVGLIMSPRGNAWSGIRGLQFTHETFTTITIPVFSPSC